MKTFASLTCCNRRLFRYKYSNTHLRYARKFIDYIAWFGDSSRSCNVRIRLLEGWYVADSKHEQRCPLLDLENDIVPCCRLPSWHQLLGHHPHHPAHTSEVTTSSKSSPRLEFLQFVSECLVMMRPWGRKYSQNTINQPHNYSTK